MPLNATAPRRQTLAHGVIPGELRSLSPSASLPPSLPSCPSFKNPCDYFMGVIRDPGATEALATAYTKARPALLQHMEAAGRATLASVASQRAASMRAPTNGGGVQQQDGDAVIELGGLDKDLGRQLAPRDSGQSGLSEEEGGRGAEGEESLAGAELTARVPMWYQVSSRGLGWRWGRCGLGRGGVVGLGGGAVEHWDGARLCC